MNVKRILVILLMLPIFVIVADKYLLGGILRVAFLRDIDTVVNAGSRPAVADDSLPCDAVKSVYDVKLTMSNGAWRLAGDTNNQPPSDTTAKLNNTGSNSGLSPAQSPADADLSDLYRAVVSGSTLSIQNLHPDEICSFTANVQGVGMYYSTNDTAATDIPTNPDASTFAVYEQEDYLPIFGYHSIVSDQNLTPGPLEMTLSPFIEQVEYATDVMGCRWYTFSDIMQNYVSQGKKTPTRACVMTFDDGRSDNYQYAFPVLRYYGISATFFVIPSQIGSTTDYMTWAQLDDLRRAGNEISGHTVAPNAAAVNDDLDVNSAAGLTDAAKLLASKGYSVQTFAYPINGADKATIQVLKAGHFVGARDSEKPDLWRDRRALTASMDSDFVWHMYYHRPDHQVIQGDQYSATVLQSPETTDQLSAALGYTTWWQFEEGYQAAAGHPIVNSSYQPTAQSFGVVKLAAGDSISNKFIVAENSGFTLALYLSAQNSSSVKVTVDGTPVVALSPTGSNCQGAKEATFCEYDFSTSLKTGAHTLTVAASGSGLLLDKFRVFRNFNIQSTYSVEITEYGSVQPAVPAEKVVPQD